MSVFLTYLNLDFIKQSYKKKDNEDVKYDYLVYGL